MNDKLKTLTLYREPSRSGATLGRLVAPSAGGGGIWICDTLEDEVRLAPDGSGHKVPGKTAIPAGRYRLRFSYSPKFRRVTLEVMEVPRFSGVRIHAGNTANDTNGCILVGRRAGEARLSHSREHLQVVEQWVKSFGAEGWLEIVEV